MPALATALATSGSGRRILGHWRVERSARGCGPAGAAGRVVPLRRQCRVRTPSASATGALQRDPLAPRLACLRRRLLVAALARAPRGATLFRDRAHQPAGFKRRRTASSASAAKAPTSAAWGDARSAGYGRPSSAGSAAFPGGVDWKGDCERAPSSPPGAVEAGTARVSAVEGGTRCRRRKRRNLRRDRADGDRRGSRRNPLPPRG